MRAEHLTNQEVKGREIMKKTGRKGWINVLMWTEIRQKRTGK